MTYFSGINIKGDTGNLDAFGRLRTSSQDTLFASSLQYGLEPLLWQSITSGGTESITHNPDDSSAKLTLGTASGEYIIRQTYQYFNYLPGKSQQIFMTGNLGPQKANYLSRIGYYDNNNGIFFESNESDIRIVLRSSITGTSSDARFVPQSSWNIDKMDGTGPSGVVLDTSKSLIYGFQLEWLGVGSVWAFVVSNGNIYYVHRFDNDNIFTSTYMTTASLPLRYECSNIGITASSTDMCQICAQVSSEGGLLEDSAYQFAISSGSTLNSVASREHLLSIRPRLLFNSIENRINILPLQIENLVADNNALIEVFAYPDFTGGDWTNVDANNSAAEYSINTTPSNGLKIAEYYASTGRQVDTIAKSNFNNRLFLTLDYAGSGQRGLSIFGTSLNLTADIGTAISWAEFR